MSKNHNENDRPFSSCRTTTADGNTRQQKSQCMNTVVENMNGY